MANYVVLVVTIIKKGDWVQAPESRDDVHVFVRRVCSLGPLHIMSRFQFRWV